MQDLINTEFLLRLWGLIVLLNIVLEILPLLDTGSAIDRYCGKLKERLIEIILANLNFIFYDVSIIVLRLFFWLIIIIRLRLLF